MIEIKGYQSTEPAAGYSLEDLISTERDNARMSAQIEQLHRAYLKGGYRLEERIALIFDWKEKSEE